MAAAGGADGGGAGGKDAPPSSTLMDRINSTDTEKQRLVRARPRRMRTPRVRRRASVCVGVQERRIWELERKQQEMEAKLKRAAMVTQTLRKKLVTKKPPEPSVALTSEPPDHDVDRDAEAEEPAGARCGRAM